MTLVLSIASKPDGAEGVRATFEMSGVGRATIGRDTNCDWPLRDPQRLVSSRHCEIVGDGERYALRDLSTNGVFVNGAAARLEQAHVLRDGDTFAVGGYVIRAQVGAGAVRPAPAAGPAERTSHPAQRGADPAAALAYGGAAPAPADDRMTVIRPAPRPGAAPVPPPPAPSPPLPPERPAASPAPAPTARPESLWEAPRPATAPTPASEPAPALAAAIAALRAVADEQAAFRRMIGARRTVTRAAPYRPGGLFSAPPEAVAARVARGEIDGPELFRAAAEALVVEQKRISATIAQAAAATAADLSPAALGAGRTDGADRKAEIWDYYLRLFVEFGEDWESGFREAMRLKLGAAYDGDGTGGGPA